MGSSTPCPSTSPPTLSSAIISLRILKRRGTKPSGPSAKQTRPHNWDRHARHHRRRGLGTGPCSAAAKPQTTPHRLLQTFDYEQSCKSELIQCTCGSVRCLEAGFETPAVVGNLSQSSATTGRVFGNTKSRRLVSPLGVAERRAGIIVLPPRSTFRRRRLHTDNVTQGKLTSSGISADRRFDSLQSDPDGIRDILRRLITTPVSFVHFLVSHSFVKLWPPPMQAKAKLTLKEQKRTTIRAKRRAPRTTVYVCAEL